MLVKHLTPPPSRCFVFSPLPRTPSPWNPSLIFFLALQGFEYLGHKFDEAVVTLTNVKSIINKSRTAFASLTKVWNSNYLHKNQVKVFFISNVLSVLLYRAYKNMISPEHFLTDGHFDLGVAPLIKSKAFCNASIHHTPAKKDYKFTNRPTDQ